MLEESPPPSFWYGKGYAQPFLIDNGFVRGKIVRLGSELDTILSTHAYPAVINGYITELLLIATALVADIKTDGCITVQITQGEIIRTLVVDVNSQGHLRGWADFDESNLIDAVTQETKTFEDLFKNGVLVFTLSLSHQVEKQQAIVELKGKNLEECLRHYFDQSDQITSSLRLATSPGVTLCALDKLCEDLPIASDSLSNVVDIETKNNLTRQLPFLGGAMILQAVPLRASNANTPQEPIEEEDRENKWQELELLMATLKATELCDPHLSPEALLLRLFHEHNPILFSSKPLKAACSCSREKLLSVLSSFNEETLETMFIDHGIEASCQFCKKNYLFTREDIALSRAPQ